MAQEKAILEDPTVYQYDEVYDSLVTQKESKTIKSRDNKNPKYIENLLKTANKRKIENERRIERQIQKEREKEGEEFADKEVFVTSAYKQKLEELRLEEEKEKREEYLEKIGDVTQQQDLGGFYRHLFEQKLGFDRPVKEENNKKPEEKESLNTDAGESDMLPHSKKRNYRKRRKSSQDPNMSEGEIEDSDNEINQVQASQKKSKHNDDNIDADSDFLVDESSDDEQKPKKPIFKPITEDEFKKPDIVKGSEPEIKEAKPKIEEKIQPKLDIWKKRTVGEAFEQALKRYYERKAARGS